MLPLSSPSSVFCAIDTTDCSNAVDLIKRIAPHVGGIKLGLEFFLAHGATGYRRVAEVGVPIFLDLKLHDIPNTVAGALRAILPLNPAYITIHTAGGASMMRAAMAALPPTSPRPKILGVTVLTSLNDTDLVDVGQSPPTTNQVLRLAKLAKNNGLDGIVCSPHEITPLRAELGDDFVLMVPGIRPTWADSHDQKRVMTPTEAAQAGATHLVIGRPITAAADPASAAQRIAEELNAA